MMGFLGIGNNPMVGCTVAYPLIQVNFDGGDSFRESYSTLIFDITLLDVR